MYFLCCIFVLNKQKLAKMENLKRIKELEAQLDALYSEMPQTHFQLNQRNKSAFLIAKELEQLKDPKSYQENKNHWEGHEIRL